MDNSQSLADTCRLLIEQRWLPLRRLSPLLGYSHGTGIYGRQRSSNPAHRIPTIQVGGTYRVHYDDVIQCLENPIKEDLTTAYQNVLDYIHRLERLNALNTLDALNSNSNNSSIKNKDAT